MKIEDFVPTSAEALEKLKKRLEDPNRKYNTEFKRKDLIKRHEKGEDDYICFLILGRSAISGFEILGGDLGDDDEFALAFIDTLQPQYEKIKEDLERDPALTYIAFNRPNGGQSYLLKHLISDHNLQYYLVPPQIEPFKVLK